MDPTTIAQRRADLRAARHALHALADARRARLLRDQLCGEFAAPIAQARAALRTARQALRDALTT